MRHVISTSLGVVLDGRGEPDGRGALARRVDAARRDLVHVAEQLRLGRARVAAEQHVDLAAQPLAAAVRVAAARARAAVDARAVRAAEELAAEEVAPPHASAGDYGVRRG